MVRWLLFALCLAVITGVLTIIWWWVGDLWADEEHKRFNSGHGDTHSGATVIRGFNQPDGTPERDASDRSVPGDENLGTRR